MGSCDRGRGTDDRLPQGDGSVTREFHWKVRVYYEDTDCGGVVYHAGYLRFMERARTEWLRALGFHQDQMRGEHNLVFIVTAMDIQFTRPGRLDDELTVSVLLEEVRGASMVLEQQVVRDSDQTVLCSARVRAACVDPGDFRPRRLPKAIVSEMNA
ncbi:MAG: tol-pal system-associated acyl-CoA thioesterase [Gammaproteobacteria bacterium]|nr:MAG: tol-pal system-associated acyl-CoA thioesterase [Gammaproteobacteria bacterium]